MIKDFWKNIDFFCMHHDEPILLEYEEGTNSTYYICKNKGCKNRISYSLAMKVVEKLESDISGDVLTGGNGIISGRCYSIKNYRITVLSHVRCGRIKVGILNKENVS